MTTIDYPDGMVTLATPPTSIPFSDRDSWKQHYDEFGFCVIEGVYAADELDAIERFFEDFRNRREEAFHNGKAYAEIDPDKELLRALHPHRYDERVMDWFMHPRLCDVLAVLLGAEPLGAQTMYYYKPPGSVGQGMHQDNLYLLAAPAACIGTWTPLDDADEENGCLFVKPQAHGHGILCKDRDSRWEGMPEAIGGELARKIKPVAVPVKRGETLFFHGELPHGSGRNRSRTRSRRTFIGHYCDRTTTEIAKFYHPIVNRHGETVSDIAVYAGGGPCADGWQGAVH